MTDPSRDTPQVADTGMPILNDVPDIDTFIDAPSPGTVLLLKERKSRVLSWLPVLCLTVPCAWLATRLTSQNEPRVSVVLPRSEIVPPAINVPAEPADKDAIAPAQVEVETAAEAADPPPPAEPASKVILKVNAAEPPEPPRVDESEAPVDTLAAWSEIEREAALREADRRHLESLKPVLLARETEERAAESRAARVAFQSKLRGLLAQNAGGDAWQSLANSADEAAAFSHSGRPSPIDLARSRTARAEWVCILRSRHVPEPQILLELARAMALNTSARNGPRTAEDAFRRAAAELLNIPIDQKPDDNPDPVARRPEPKPSAPISQSRSRRRTAGGNL